MKTVHLLIKGKVQGVFYRVSAQEKAEELGITGWVKNTKEGNVEAVASGNDVKVEAFVQWCAKGPSRAVVDEVIVTEKDPEEYKGFEVIR
jgi:acylphosphatase